MAGAYQSPFNGKETGADALYRFFFHSDHRKGCAGLVGPLFQKTEGSVSHLIGWRESR